MSIPASRAGAPAAQEQFLTVLSREEATRRFQNHLSMAPVGEETVALAASLGRVLAQTLRAPIDVPPFDRSLVDGFAVSAADVAAASESAPIRLRLNGETIACGIAPKLEVARGTATPIATGGPLPRGADAVCMVEHTDPDGPDHVLVRRSLASGQNIGFAGGDIAQGETLLRRGGRIGSREIGMLAACGLARIPVYRRPRVAILSTGDELVQPANPCAPPRSIQFKRADHRRGGPGKRRRARPSRRPGVRRDRATGCRCAAIRAARCRG